MAQNSFLSPRVPGPLQCSETAGSPAVLSQQRSFAGASRGTVAVVGMSQVALRQHAKPFAPAAADNCLKPRPREASKPESK